MSCKGLCRKHPKFNPTKKIDYAKGMKVCTVCDMAVFINIEEAKCPCCNKSLRYKPQYHGERGRISREAVAKRVTSC